MEKIQIKDKFFVPYMRAEEIADIVSCLAEKLNRDYVDKDPLFIGILNGAFLFSADLFRQLQMPCRISFVKVSSYQGTQTTNCIKQLIGLNEDVSGRDIVILEDIIDTGFSMSCVVKDLESRGANSIRLCTLLFKPDSFTQSYKIDYIGKSIPNDFVVGYGFDYDGYGRNLPSIYQICQ